MERADVERIPEKIDSKFRFVLLAAERAEQMIRGAKPKVESRSRKLSRIALQEIMDDEVEWDYGPPEVAEDELMIEGEEGAEEASD